MMESEPTPRAARILIVDDDAVCRLFCKQVLASRGRQLFSASSVAAAIELVRSTHPALVILDLHLGQDEGRTVLEAIRSSRRGRLPAPVFIGMTGDSSRAIHTRALRAGFLQVLLKPFSAQALREITDEVLGDLPSGSLDASLQNLEHALRREWGPGLDELDRYITALDWGAALATIHRLHGAAAFAGHPELAEGARRLTRDIRLAPGSQEMAGAYLDFLSMGATFLHAGG